MRASVVNNCVHLYVEDSGPGIPAGKRDMLFNKFQESLDSLNQGTGIGLSLCKNLAELMGAEISYDASYNSGVNGYPGTRFVINLNAPPLKLDDAALDVLKLSRPIPSIEQPTMDGTSITDGTSHTQEMSDVDVEIAKQPSRAKLVLPETMSLLFVDDDLVLRKLFSRAVKRVAPGWTVHEAASGEVALRLVENGESFGIMFVDQYVSAAASARTAWANCLLSRLTNSKLTFATHLDGECRETTSRDRNCEAFTSKRRYCSNLWVVCKRRGAVVL